MSEMRCLYVGQSVNVLTRVFGSGGYTHTMRTQLQWRQLEIQSRVRAYVAFWYWPFRNSLGSLEEALKERLLPEHDGELYVRGDTPLPPGWPALHPPDDIRHWDDMGRKGERDYPGCYAWFMPDDEWCRWKVEETSDTNARLERARALDNATSPPA